MILPFDCLDMFSSLLPQSGSWLIATAESTLRIDDAVAAGLTEAHQDEHRGSFTASVRFAMLALMLVTSAALVWWRWRPVKWLPERRQFEAIEPSSGQQIAELRRRHAKHRDHEADRRMDALLELHRCYTRGDTAAAYEGLKRHFETHPFELNLYLVCLNMLAETGSKPSPEMIRLFRHAFRQLKLLRPHMWVAVAEQGRRLVPDFERWDDKPTLSSGKRPRF